MDELKAKQKKEIKAFETDKRIALKKVKGSSGKGKKLKEALAKAETEWDAKFKELTEKHETELQELSGGEQEEAAAAVATEATETTETEPSEEEKARSAKEKALAKKLRKKQQKLAKEKAREEQIAHDIANAPNPRQLEMDAIMNLYLAKDNLIIEEVAADGNCLYRAVAKQLEIISASSSSSTSSSSSSASDDDGTFTYESIRHKCADEIMKYREEYEPFADLAEMKVDTFDEYVEKVRDSSEWGGHLELRALAHSFNKTIVVYSTEEPLMIQGRKNGNETGGDDDKEDNDDAAIRLSFHRQYYALGEHYNSVVPKVNQ